MKTKFISLWIACLTVLSLSAIASADGQNGVCVISFIPGANGDYACTLQLNGTTIETLSFLIDPDGRYPAAAHDEVLADAQKLKSQGVCAVILDKTN